jgi:hypothetical protein
MDNQQRIDANRERLALLENQRLVDIVKALGPEWMITEAESGLFKFTRATDWHITTRDCKSFEFWVSQELASVHSYHTDKLPSANINENKSPEKVAAEIQRRLVEPAQPILVALRERLAHSQARAAKIQENIRRLIEANPEAAQTHNTKESIYLNQSGEDHVYLSGTVQEDSVHFERVTLSIEMAVELFRLTTKEKL